MPPMRFTVLHTIDGRFAGKRPYVVEGGRLEFRGYGAGDLFLCQGGSVVGIGGLYRFLTAMSGVSDAFVVRAAPRDGIDLKRPIRRRYNNPEGGNDLVPYPRNWIALDLDDFPVMDPLGEGAHIREAARYARDGLLPSAFRGVDCVVTPTTKTGLRGSTRARLRLWFILDRAIGDKRLGQWAADVELVTRIGLDPVTMRSVQPIYTARAPYPAGFVDPVAHEDRVFILDGAISDCVSIDLDEFTSRASALRGQMQAQHTAQIAQRAFSTTTPQGGWFEYGLRTVGVGNHVREAAVRTIGRAVSEGASDDEIEEGILDLVEPYGGLERVDSYGGLDGWLRRTIRDIRARQSAQDARAHAARRRLHSFLSKR